MKAIAHSAQVRLATHICFATYLLHALRQTGTATDSGIEIDIWDM